MSSCPKTMRSGSLLFREHVEQNYPDYLRDESRLVGQAASISFPTTEDEVRAVLAWAHEANMPVTIQGGRTGITGGAVPQGGHILNLSRMNRIVGFRVESERNSALVTVQPGVTLAELRKALARHNAAKSLNSRHATGRTDQTPPFFFLPPDPTEDTATIGGMINCNASGSLSFRYGSVRPYVERLRVILSDGRSLNLHRGIEKVQGRRFELATEDGTVLHGPLPSYIMPAIKNAAGYFVRDDMDLLDLFIGAEGTLGIVTEIELRLVPLPSVILGIMVFVPEEAAAVALVREVRETMKNVVALEFFDNAAIALLRRYRSYNASVAERIPSVPSDSTSAVYIEYHGNSLAEIENEVMTLAAGLSRYGADDADTWIADTPTELSRLKEFRHAVPEAVNREIDERRKCEPTLTKLGTDLAVPDAALERAMRMYRDGLAQFGLEAVVFGHIGDNHVHVNIISRNTDEYRRGRELYLEWARAVVGLGGTVSAEHGIGKLKRALLEILYGVDGVRMMRETKYLFDPRWILNRGNLFEP